MNKENDSELHISIDPDVISTVKELEKMYVFLETGLTPETLYNENDYCLYSEIAEELIPEPLSIFLYHGGKDQ